MALPFPSEGKVNVFLEYSLPQGVPTALTNLSKTFLDPLNPTPDLPLKHLPR
jgi:hypothetical protein